jgi:Phage-related minor tail protein
MASTRVRGITIELGADTSGLSKALKGINTEIKNTSKDLKDVERLLKLDPTNVELLAQKQRLLSDRVEETKTKLDALKQAQESIDLSTEEGQRQYDALTREIVSCENELKQAEQAAAGFNATAERISTSAGKISQSIGNMADKTRGLSMAATGAISGLAGIAVKAAKDADDLYTLAKQTGLSTKELQKMQYASDLIDVDTDTIVSGIRKLKKNLDGQEKTWKKLGVNVKNANGEYRDITDIFYDTVAALGNIENETERDTLAMDLFGKSADELAGIIDDGGAALKRLGAEAENMGVIISQDDLDKANELNDTLDKLKAEVLPVIAQLGVQIADAIMPYIPQIQAGIEKVLEVLKNVSPETIAIVGAVLAVSSALSPVLTIISGLVSGFGSLVGLIPKISTFFSSVTDMAKNIAPGLSTALNSLTTFMTQDIGATLAAGGAQAGAMAAAAIGGSIIAALAGMELGKTIGAYIFPDDAELYESYSGLEGTFNMLKDLGIALKDFFVMTWEDIVKNEKKNFDALSQAFDAVCTLMSNAWTKTWNAMKSTFTSIWNSIKSAFVDVINGFISGLNRVSSGISKVTGGSVNLGQIAYLAEGGVLTSGTAVVGEAGPELVSVSNGNAMVQPLTGDGDLIGLLQTYLPYLAAGTQMVLDSGALVGGIAPDMNTALGTISLRSGNR